MFQVRMIKYLSLFIGMGCSSTSRMIIIHNKLPLMINKTGNNEQATFSKNKVYETRTSERISKR